MLEQTKRISFGISSVLYKVEPEQDLYTGSGQKVPAPAPQHCSNKPTCQPRVEPCLPEPLSAAWPRWWKPRRWCPSEGPRSPAARRSAPASRCSPRTRHRWSPGRGHRGIPLMDNEYLLIRNYLLNTVRGLSSWLLRRLKYRYCNMLLEDTGNDMLRPGAAKKWEDLN